MEGRVRNEGGGDSEGGEGETVREGWLYSSLVNVVCQFQVMMLELAQHAMAFLHKHDRPQVSLHQEMVMRQKEEEMKKKKQMEDEELKFRMKEVEEVSGCGLWGRT